jgi:hypothetical protein
VGSRGARRVAPHTNSPWAVGCVNAFPHVKKSELPLWKRIIRHVGQRFDLATSKASVLVMVLLVRAVTSAMVTRRRKLSAALRPSVRVTRIKKKVTCCKHSLSDQVHASKVRCTFLPTAYKTTQQHGISGHHMLLVGQRHTHHYTTREPLPRGSRPLIQYLNMFLHGHNHHKDQEQLQTTL